MKAIFSIIFLFFGMTINAQYKPVVEEGKSWSYLGKTFGREFDMWTHTCTFFMQGDTIIGKKTYKKVWESWTQDFSDMKLSKYAVREHKKKVYVYLYGQRKEYIWFNFNLKEGDTFRTGLFTSTNEEGEKETDPIIIDKVEEVQLPHSQFKTRRYEAYGGLLVYYEGIGTMPWGLHPDCYNPVIGGSYYMLCCHDGEGNQLYGYEPSSDNGSFTILSGLCYFDYSMLEGIKTPTTDADSSSPTIYDIDGRRLPSKPSHGVYIENGKKRMAR